MCNCIEIKSKKLKEKFGYRTVIFDMDILSNRIAVGFGGIDKNGKVFDGKQDLKRAFKEVRGYN